MQAIVIGFCLSLVGHATESIPAVTTSPASTKDTILLVKPRIPEKKFVVPALPPQMPTWPDQKIEVVDDTAKVLVRLQRAAKEVRIVEVWSLDPSVTPSQEREKKSRPYPFHEFHSLGREELKGDAEIHTLLLPVILSIANGPDETNDCFDPRHGLRLYDRKGFIDVVLCYTCLQGVLYDGKEVMWFSTSKDAEAEFDLVFRKLGLKKAD